jgi:class 3 adenylate cyclase
MRAPIRYARSGDVNIAYQVTGGGDRDLVLVPGFVSHLELDWEDPRSADFLDGLGSFARLIRFDKRGTGLSDRPGGVPDLETRMDDVRAVMDAVGSERAALFGYSEGAPLSILFAAARPERAADLILYGGYAKRLRSPDYPWAPTAEERDAYAAQVEAKWAFEADMRRMCPSADEAMARWWEFRARAAASPGAARALVEMNSHIDVRDVLPSVHVPTLVLHRAGDLDSSPDEGRFIADRIPGARFVELAGVDHCPWIDADDIVDEIQQFLTGEQRPPRTQRVLATIMFTDIVRSTEHAVRVGDSDWTALLSAHDGAVRRELKRFAGEEVKTTGDGFLAVFDGPARAIRSALAVSQTASELGLEVRAGVHTGEIERAAGDVHGVAVHAAARIMGEAGPEEVLVSATTMDLVAGSGLSFVDRGERELKGIGSKRLFAAVNG